MMSPRDSAPVVLRGATIVNTRDGSLYPKRDLTLAGGRIAEIAPTNADRDVAVVDVSGKYVVPGYLDVHSHVAGAPTDDPAADLDLMLASGITGFRLMGASAELLARRAAGEPLTSPEAPAVLAMPGEVLTPVNAATADMAVATVRAQHAAGADFVKIVFVTPEVFSAVQDEANRLGIPALGHLPAGIDVREASRRGMRSIEHLGPGTGILAACSAEEQRILEMLGGAGPTTPPAGTAPAFDLVKRVVNPIVDTPPVELDALRLAIDTFDEDRAGSVAARLVADGTWQCPTLIRERTSMRCDLPEFRDDADARYLAPATREIWEEVARRFDALDETVKSIHRDTYEVLLRLAGVLDAAGVHLLAGSDSGGAIWEVPGPSLHQEFDELARAGLSPLRVLQATTVHAAEFLGMAGTLGTVDVGARGDLVVLDGNPVESVDHLHGIAGVVRSGRYVPREELDMLRHRVAESRTARTR